jgi:hypothetical protein
MSDYHQYQSYPPAPPQPSGNGQAVASLVLGIVGLIAWCIPICGLPISIVGLILGIRQMNSPSSGLAIAGVILNSLGLLASIVNAGVGVYLGITGQHPLLN